MAQFLQAKDCLEEKIMERIHMNHLRDLIQRFKAGESERRIAQDMGLSRPTIHKYYFNGKGKGLSRKSCVAAG